MVGEGTGGTLGGGGGRLDGQLGVKETGRGGGGGGGGGPSGLSRRIENLEDSVWTGEGNGGYKHPEERSPGTAEGEW